MNLRRRQQPAPRGQEVAKGVVRPPVTTVKQETQPTRTETPEPRSYGEQLRRQAEALQQQVRDLMAANTELWDAIRTRDGRIVGLSGDNYRLTEGNKTLAKRVTALEAEVGQRKETARNLALAAEEVDKRHRAAVGRLEGMLDVLRAQMDGTGRPESTDPEPTGVVRTAGPDQTGWLPLADPDAPRSLLTPWQTGGGAAPRVSDDLLATGWLPRSSGGQSAPMVGE